MIKRILLIFFFLIQSLILIDNSNAKIFIVAEVEGDIITNNDIEKEIEYLKLLNPNLNQLKKEQTFKIAKDALISEIIKKKEIAKLGINSNQDRATNTFLQDLYKNLKFNSIEDFKSNLEQLNTYSFEQLKKKIRINFLWNDLIISKYINLVSIDKEKILEKLNQSKNNIKKEYNLSEIVFRIKTNVKLDEYYNEIKLSIKEIGFENSANIYSISGSSLKSGKIGWVDQNNIDKEILSKLENLEIGETTDLIKVGNNFLILKLNDLKISNISLDKEIELQKLINLSTNKQLENYSRIYFDKLKINYKINEK